MKIKSKICPVSLSFSKKAVLNQNGFNLIEIIFSIGIITVGIISLLSLFTYNVRIKIDSKNKLIAIYLAQESIEVVRQLRDNNWFSGNNWDDNFDNIQSTGDDGITGLKNINDINAGWEIRKVVGGGNQWKKKIYLLANGSYVQSNNVIPGGTYTGFDRYLTITKGDDPTPPPGCFGNADCMEITSYVYFKGDLIAEATAHLYDQWY